MLASTKWQKLKSNLAPPPRYFHSSVLYNGDIYIIGGTKNSTTLFNDMWKFDTKEWKCVIENNTRTSGRYGHESFVIQNKIFIYGGRNSKHELRDICYCDMTAKNPVWKKISESKFPHNEISGTVYPKCLSIGNQLYFYGGIRMKKSHDSSKTKFQQLVTETQSKVVQENLRDLLDVLSDDVILQILYFLSVKDIGNVSLVSKKWKLSQLSNCN